ncbi:MAG: PilC/PilY family type IV pilus protein [Gammaproteobacteria bacterium]|nr:PilC/PilY family type IV pilus protein [Gammaproteobacteria bacterium]
MKHQTLRQRTLNLVAAMGLGALCAMAPPTHAAQLTLADTPLFLGGMEPNVFFMIDDSGSMDWEVTTSRYSAFFSYWDEAAGPIWVDNGLWLSWTPVTPCSGWRNLAYLFRNTDNAYSTCTFFELDRNAGYYDQDWRGLAPQFNVMYYDPTSEYRPWVGMPDASFSAVRSDPKDGTDGYDITRDLGNATLISDGAGFVHEYAIDDMGFSGTHPAGPASATATPDGNGLIDVWDSHVQFRFTGGAVNVETYTYDPTDPSNPDDACGIDDAVDSPRFKDCLGTTRTTETLTDGAACYDILGNNPDTVIPAVVAGTATIDATGGAGCRTIAEAEQNVANWYQYSRKRSYVAKGAIAALLDAIPGYRYGLSVINQDDDLEDDDLFVEMPEAGSDYVTHNNGLLNQFFDFDWPAAGTPLRNGLRRAGEYYKGSLDSKPSPIVESCQKNFTLLFTDGFWNGDDPEGIADEDGDDIADTLADVAHKYYVDDLAPTLDNDVPGDSFDPADWQHMVTMSVAFGVAGILRDEFKNDTVVAGGDIASATGSGPPDGLPDTQRDGSLWDGDGANNQPLFDAPQENQGWYDADVLNVEDGRKIDDMWHAAFNSKGVYINAQTPDELVAAMQGALSNIAERISSASSVALNSGSLNENTRTYQARFDSELWSGELLSIPISNGSASSTCTTEPVGALCPAEWRAATKLSGQDWDNGREILTLFPGEGDTDPGGVAFRWENLSSAQQQSLNTDPDSGVVQDDDTGEARLKFLRGDFSNEETGLGFRQRAVIVEDTDGNLVERTDVTVLGDIIQSSPVFVGAPSFGFPNSLKGGTRTSPGTTYAETYAEFIERMAALNSGAGRTPTIYVGANDGMMHAINAFFDADNNPTEDSGTEIFAYVPNVLFDRLPELTSPNYEHKYFVNGNITRMDAFFDGDNEWHTVVVGSLRAGGQGIYALDVTDPDAVSEASAGNAVLWEFTDLDNPSTDDGGAPLVDGDPDLGYTFSQPAVGRMANGQWVAMFGNGHNNTESDGSASTTGNAVLYIVDLQTGELVRKLDTGKGSADDPTENDRPNALATVTPIDQNGDLFIEAIYGGDLFGNVWKFDVSSTNPNEWQIANRDGSDNPVPLFVTEDPDIVIADTGAPQPITTRIVTGPHPTSPVGVMIYFGTGKYVETTDNSSSNNQTQTFYGIWDDGSTSPSIDRDDLLVQDIIHEQEHEFCAVAEGGADVCPDGIGEEDDTCTCVTETIRVTSDPEDSDPEDDTAYQIDWGTHKGWLMDLILDDSDDNRGELVDADPILRNGRIIFITTLPNESPCAFGGDSFIMELDANDGSRLAFTPFDLNNDGEFDEGDYVTIFINDVEVRVPTSGRKSKQGIIQKPGVLVSGLKEFKYASGSAGGIDVTVENPGPLTMGRQSWRQLR